ncbi:MAG: hypothetical protein ACOVLC_00130 [Flavobacterium sp.]
MTTNPELDNDWAKDIKGEEIHISAAKSGAQGYYCLGCDKEMQAVKKKNINHKSYFRHHVVDVDKSTIECVHASRTYREKLAYFHFQRTKEINLPAVYKFPPKGTDGNPVLIEESKTVRAFKIEKELTFYENEDGEIKWGKNPEIEERFLLVRPDAVFFDANEKPILFLEFVVTHKPDLEKINKLKRLGIATVQIIVPKKDESEIIKAITKTSNIKWTYHEIESNTEYIPVSEGIGEGIPSIDDIQRKLFAESFACRAAQIGNLIRTINRILGSESYKRVEFSFEREISRIEAATKRERARLDALEAAAEIEIRSELESRYAEFEEERSRIEEDENSFREYKTDLEERYNWRKDEIRQEQKDLNREIEFRERVGTTEEAIRREFTFSEKGISSAKRNISDEEDGIARQIEDIDRRIESFRKSYQIESTFKRDFDEITRREQADFDKKKREFLEEKRISKDDFIRTRTDLESKIYKDREQENLFESTIRSGFERRYQQSFERINNRDVQGGDELSERIKAILELRGLFDSYRHGQTTIEKYRKGIQSIKDGTWQKKH